MVTGSNTASSVVDDGQQPPQRHKSENRRSNKPIMEKRRRARINNCLNELKSLILDAMKKDPARHSKLEKADILEMTVKHLESMQRQQVALAAATDPKVLNKFRAGFTECAGEVGRFPGLEPPVKRRLLQHLANCLNSNNIGLGTTEKKEVQVTIVPEQNIVLSAGNLQLVPTRLPNGDIALVLPSAHVRTTTATTATVPSVQNIVVTPASPASPTAASTSPPPLVRSSPPPLAPTPPLSPPLSHSPAPISLVVNKTPTIHVEEKPWRPW